MLLGKEIRKCRRDCGVEWAGCVFVCRVVVFAALAVSEIPSVICALEGVLAVMRWWVATVWGRVCGFGMDYGGRLLTIGFLIGTI